MAAIIGGLGSFSGAVVGGLALGLAEVALRVYLPDGRVGAADRRRRVRARRRPVHHPPAGAVHGAHRGARVMEPLAARLGSQRRSPAAALFVVLLAGATDVHGDRRRGPRPARPGAARQPRARDGAAGVHRLDRASCRSATSPSPRSPPTARRSWRSPPPPRRPACPTCRSGSATSSSAPFGGDASSACVVAARRRRRRRRRRRPGRWAGGDDDHARRALRRRPGGEELDRADARRRRAVRRAADR